MWMLLVTVVVVGATAYIWCTRGFFSSLIHMLCVIAAGAIAFGMWELLADLIREKAPDRGAFNFLQGAALGLSLALPFALSLAILRGIIDKILPANAQCEKVADYVGGGVCGLVSGIISAGIVVLSVGFLRTDHDFLGYSAANYTAGSGRGSMEKSHEKFVPWVDRITAALYSQLSTTTLRTAEPLAKWHPELVTYPGELRTTYDDKSRNSISRRDFQVLGWYTVGDAQKGTPYKNLLVDDWNAHVQKISDLEGDDITGSGYLAGFAFKFRASAREKTGTVIIGNSQMRLIVTDGDEDNPETRVLHPIAMIGRIDSATRVDYARFRYDSDNLYISSVGAEAEPVMAFEFPVPPGFKPLALYIKGVRWEMPPGQAPTRVFPTPAARDQVVKDGEFFDMGGIGPIIDPNTGKPVVDQTTSTFTAAPFTVGNSLGFTIQKGTEGPNLTLTDDGKGWAIQDGRTDIFNSKIAGRGALEKPLRVERFALTGDTAIVKIVVSPSERDAVFGDLLETIDRNAQPLLVDTSDTTYPAVGYIYKDSTVTTVRYTQANPIKNWGELPSVTRNTPDKKLTLVFVVNNGVDIKELRVGSVQLEDWAARPKHVEFFNRR
jgi:hypothetical protein